MLFVHKRLSSCAETAQLKAHDLPFMNLTVSNLNRCDFATSGHTCDVSVHEQHSQNVLESENFKIILVTVMVIVYSMQYSIQLATAVANWTSATSHCADT